MMELNELSLDIASLLKGYVEGNFTPADVIETIQARIKRQPNHNAWITKLSDAQIQDYLDALGPVDIEAKPLYGIPFAIKDNIDLAGVPTTAACAEYAYTPDESAFVVQCLIDAGAIPVGKTNLDQFATGLVGVRSPYGVGHNSFNYDYISGGSSSGSAVSLAMGQVSFSLGTDTAGSGRVPAAFNNLVGLKPTKGWLSTSGVVPACRSLDCVSVFALCAADAQRVLDVAGQFDVADEYARPAPSSEPAFDAGNFSFAVPREEQLEFFGNEGGGQLFYQAVTQLEALGGKKREIDFEPFLESARLLYEGPWVSERYVAIESFIKEQADAVFPVTRKIIEGGEHPSAADAFRSQYRLAALKRKTDPVWGEVDFVLTPTAGRCYTIEEVEADPIQLNSNLGYYTNFMNLLDFSALAVPTGFQSDGLPFGVTLFAPAFADRALLNVGDRLHRELATTQGATGLPLPEAVSQQSLAPGWTRVAVCGAHLSGLPLNHQLTDRGAYLLEQTRSSGHYRLYALPGGPPYRPGMLRDEGGAAIEIEIWAIPLDQFGSFVAGIPAPLGIGMLETAAGEWVQGFICESFAVAEATEITRLGGWRAYLEQQS
jgi:allophanate hydrolase